MSNPAYYFLLGSVVNLSSSWLIRIISYHIICLLFSVMFSEFSWVRPRGRYWHCPRWCSNTKTSRNQDRGWQERKAVSILWWGIYYRKGKSRVVTWIRLGILFLIKTKIGTQNNCAFVMLLWKVMIHLVYSGIRLLYCTRFLFHTTVLSRSKSIL